ncbi:hypothetical protein MNBD_NITROSPINAE02-1127 [hydrothermal vent metagenome]|uniref:Uncharacterized protein n=1 Tax=hydrothermal vent metagenome TaxID=652676 RepID=A0A3B1CS94_9ZZZZ
MDEATARLVLTLGLGFVATLILTFYWDHLAKLSEKIFPDPEKRFKIFVIFLIMSIALVGAFVSIVKMFRMIDILTR